MDGWRSPLRSTSDAYRNEPWFLIEGLLWAAIAWVGALRASPRRWWWVGSALAATAVATAIGLLSVFGVIGKWIVA